MTPSPTSTNRGQVTLKEHLESRLLAIEKAIEVANTSMQARLAGMNEFRETLKDQASRFITRDELDAKLRLIGSELEVLCDDIKALEISKAILEGKASKSTADMAVILAVIGLIVSLISVLVNILYP